MTTTTTSTRLPESEIKRRYDGRWVLMTDFLFDPITKDWYEAVVVADAPPEDNSSLFRLAKELDLKEIGIFFYGENPFAKLFLL